MKIFMALRITVNSELLLLEKFLEKDPINLLSDIGSIAIITFHSTEDKIVADHFSRWKRRKYGKSLFKNVVTPSDIELKENTASASAKMRIFTKH
jgi:16S rRNA (cytosine1402-N4)-methyltransferase